MGDLVYYVAMSLDGFIADQSGGVSWLDEYQASGEDYGYREFYQNRDSLLMGSKTYAQILTFGEWPYPDKPTWVMTQQQWVTCQEGIILTPQTPEGVLTEIHNHGFQKTWLVGGSTLARSFCQLGLVTEYILSIMPCLLGAGIPLLAAEASLKTLRLKDQKHFSSGVVQLRYAANAH